MMRLKNILPIGMLCLLGLWSACSQNEHFLLNGELTDYKDAQIIVLYDDPMAKLDTIFPKEGKFTYMLTPDTLTVLRLMDKQGNSIPIFADKGWEVELTGTFDKPGIKGTGANKDYQDFIAQLAASGADENSAAAEAEKFVQSHPQSIVSAYLIDRYFIQQPQPDVERIMKLIDPLHGSVKDSRMLSVAMKALPDEKAKEQTFLSYYAIKNRNGKPLSWTSSTDPHPYTLINFWASWSKNSLAGRDELQQMLKELPKNSVKILNVSLDLNKREWLRNCKADTLSWIETCDFKGWDNSLVKQHRIQQLPENILVDKKRKIMGRNLSFSEIKQKVAEAEKE